MNWLNKLIKPNKEIPKTFYVTEEDNPEGYAIIKKELESKIISEPASSLIRTLENDEWDHSVLRPPTFKFTHEWLGIKLYVSTPLWDLRTKAFCIGENWMTEHESEAVAEAAMASLYRQDAKESSRMSKIRKESLMALVTHNG